MLFRAVWPLVIAAMSLGIDAYVLAGILPRIAESLSTTVGAIGLGVTAFTGAYALVGPTLAARASARSTKGALLVALGLFTLANLLTALASNLGVFLISRVLAGGGAGILTPVATSTAARLVAPNRRGRAMALVTFGLSTGTVAGVPLGMLISGLIGWRWTMGLVVLVGTVSMAAVAFRSGTFPPLETGRASWPGVFESPQVILGVALAFLFGVTSLGLYTYLLPMSADRGLASWRFALIRVGGIGGVVSSRLIGRPIDAWGSRRLLPLIASALLASFAALSVLPQPLWWIIATLVWGAAGWASVPTLQDALTRTRTSATTGIVAVQMAAMYLGSAVGSALGAALLRGGPAPGALPLWAGAAAVLAVILAIGVADTNRAAGR